MSSSVALVAIALPRPAAARAIVAAWEAGEAVLPLDPGAPAAELKGILAVARPTLEDVYLRMIEQNSAPAGARTPEPEMAV